MASLTLPSPDSEFTKCPHCGTQMKIDRVWFQKMSELLKRVNQDTLSNLTVTATSDTNLRFSYVGSDGTTRVANLTLA